MNIFLTGASGYIGSAVARALLKDGHRVIGLTRSHQKTSLLSQMGVSPLVGDLKDPASYRQEADRCDVLVHAGFEFGPEAAHADLAATEALAASAKAARRPRLLIYTSGVWVLGPQTGRAAREDDALNPASAVAWRPAHERLALSAAAGNIRAAVIRPGCVYGECRGLYGAMLQSLFERRVIRLVAGGSNCWASVYLDDLAELYRLVVAKSASGVYHATDGGAEPVREAAEAFADAAGGGEVETLPIEEAREAMGPMADALAMDQRVSSEKARAELGWRPSLGSASKNAAALLAEWHEKSCAMSVA